MQTVLLEVAGHILPCHALHIHQLQDLLGYCVLETLHCSSNTWSASASGQLLQLLASTGQGQSHLATILVCTRSLVLHQKGLCFLNLSDQFRPEF